MRHFLCDRKLTTNTQKPRAGGGGNEEGRDEEMQMFDCLKKSFRGQERVGAKCVVSNDFCNKNDDEASSLVLHFMVINSS